MADRLIKRGRADGESPALERVAELLPNLLPQAKFEPPDIINEGAPGGSILRARIKIGEVSKTLLCAIRTRGEPKYLLNAVGQLTLAIKRSPDSYPVVITPSLSREGRAVLRDADIGSIALDGEVFLQFDTVFIELSSRPKDVKQLFSAGTIFPKRTRRLPLPFSPKASRIIRVLLERPRQLFTVRELAGKAKVNFRLALLAINKLDEKGCVRKERGAIQILKQRELLEAWAEVYKFQEANRFSYYHSIKRNFEDLAAKLEGLPAEQREDYRLTLYAGASLIAPRIRFNEVHLYIKGDPAVWAQRLDLNPVETGANVILVSPFDDGVFDFKQAKRGLNVTSNTQLFLDLYNINDRAREQAEALFDEAIAVPEPGSLGEKIKKARMERMGARGTMTRQGLGDFLAVSADTIAAWEENDAIPTPKQIESLARRLRKPVEYFQQP